jgi:hypothetical protein
MRAMVDGAKLVRRELAQGAAKNDLLSRIAETDAAWHLNRLSGAYQRRQQARLEECIGMPGLLDASSLLRIFCVLY